MVKRKSMSTWACEPEDGLMAMQLVIWECNYNPTFFHRIFPTFKSAFMGDQIAFCFAEV